MSEFSLINLLEEAEKDFGLEQDTQQAEEPQQGVGTQQGLVNPDSQDTQQGLVNPDSQDTQQGLVNPVSQDTQQGRVVPNTKSVNTGTPMTPEEAIKLVRHNIPSFVAVNKPEKDGTTLLGYSGEERYSALYMGQNGTFFVRRNYEQDKQI